MHLRAAASPANIHLSLTGRSFNKVAIHCDFQKESTMSIKDTVTSNPDLRDTIWSAALFALILIALFKL
jgi:hypothetical protein